MAKSPGQKLKLLYIVKFLTENTDENHPASTADIIAYLEANDIHSERKSIYDDIEKLCNFGYDIITVQSRLGGGYYMSGREFELAELKLLVDAVQASRFITTKKSRRLIQKLEKMAGKYDAVKLQRQVYVAGRVKTENESIYYNVDRIHHAIQAGVLISFTYLEWNVKKELQLRRGGQKYRISPWALTWQDENYYLIAYDDEEEKIKHFRVDKMNKITELSGEKRKGMEAFRQFDIAAYTKQTFGMFGGTTQSVTLRLPASMIGIILDRFGRDVSIRSLEGGHISVKVYAAVSTQFYGWVTGLGKQVSITAPYEVAEGYLQFLDKIMRNYKEKAGQDNVLEDCGQDEGL